MRLRVKSDTIAASFFCMLGKCVTFTRIITLTCVKRHRPNVSQPIPRKSRFLLQMRSADSQLVTLMENCQESREGRFRNAIRPLLHCETGLVALRNGPRGSAGRPLRQVCMAKNACKGSRDGLTAFLFHEKRKVKFSELTGHLLPYVRF